MTHRGAILRLTLAVCALAAFAAFAPAIAGAAVITPNITTDENTDNGNCSLREAVTAANTDGVYNGCSVANDSLDTITLQSSVTYSLTLPGEDALNAIGDLDVVAEPLTINVDGAFPATIDGNGDGIGDPGGIPTNDRVLEIDPLTAGGVTSVSLTKLAITDGNGDGGIRVGGPTSLAITGSRLFANHGGGSITALRQDNGDVSIVDTSIDTNTGGGGAIIQQFGTLAIERSTISGNTATAAFNDGGAIVRIGGTLTVTDSTISGNRSQAAGGGIWQNVGTTHLRNATIANNIADDNGDDNGDGGGILNTGTGIVNASNSLLADNVDGSNAGTVHDDCSGTLTGVVGGGYNLVESTDGCTLAGVTTGNVTGVGGGLLPLANNGGPTMTHALIGPTSPAIDAGNPLTPSATGPACNVTDQRGSGFGRGLNTSNCDIGAYELQQGAPQLPAIGDRTVQVGQTLSFSTAAFDINPNDTLIYSAFPLPAGSNLDFNGVFSWAPTAGQVGAHPGIQFSVGDGTASDSEIVTLTVTPLPVTTPTSTTPAAKKKCKKKKKSSASAAKKCKKKKT